MTAKKSYNRYFIIFQEEDKGYGIAIDKQPTGYTKIETRNGRCKVTVYAQNLVKDRGPYLCCLIDGSKSPAVIAKLGTITVDETGRGETWWEYREDDVAETGIPVDRFNVAAVVVEGDELKAPLAGYIGRDKISWKDKIKPQVNEVKDEVKEEIKDLKEQEEIEELDEEARKFKEYEEMIKDQSSKEEYDNSQASEDVNKEEHIKSKPQSYNKDGDFEESRQEEDHSEEDDSSEESGQQEDESHEKEDNSKTSRDIDPRETDNEDNSQIGEADEEDNKEVLNESDEESQVLKDDSIETIKDFYDEVRNGDYEDIIADVANINNQFDDIDYREDSSIYDDMENEFSRDGRKKRRRHAPMFHEVLKHFKEVEDAVEGMKDVRWWRIPHSDDIPIKENSLYPYFCSVYHLKMTYPYINYIKYYKKPGYYYFGIKYDSNGEVKYIMYGIEGRNSALEQPYMGMTGFTKWYGFKCKDKGKGMWVMYYNPYTGCIMIPKNRQ